ncbi:MAG TPA: DUF305 domain-containing protein [Candidatus Paceibacterota bacterium]|nr:DUF305 domain-containing protein [Candidatus Paceibacterota bacterium]HMO82945.1 DUF305 domain-containing protein [Candidatus Paceibacterota bacterium]
MNNKNILFGLTLFILGGIVVYYISSNDSDIHHVMTEEKVDNSHTHDHQMSGHLNRDNAESEHGMDHMMAMTVNSEQEFIEGMIPHHQEAIDTATEVLARGGTTQSMKNLAEAIIVAQEKEISDMKQWYQDWYGKAYESQNEYNPMMRELTNLSGVELDKAFLEDMIQHHMGAIMMAGSVKPYIEHEEMETITQNIISSQNAEIVAMRQILKDLMTP